MKSYTIHLIRHAYTKGNLEGRYIGHTDESLCEEGISQLNTMLKDYNYPQADVVFSSTLKRCLETAKIIYPDKNPIEMRGFDECDFGEFENLSAEIRLAFENRYIKAFCTENHPFGSQNYIFSVVLFRQKMC